MSLKKRLEKVKADVQESDRLFMLPAVFIFAIIFVTGILGINLQTLPIAFSLMTMLALAGLVWGLLVGLIKSECRSKIEFYEELMEEMEESKKN